MLTAASSSLRPNPRAFLLAAVAMLSLACALPLPAQLLHPTTPIPSFEVATIKPRDPKVMFIIDASGVHQTIRTAGTARGLVAQAFQAHYPSLQVIGGPQWIDKDPYFIEGKIPDELFTQIQTMGVTARRQPISLMLQSLLADRFKLSVHFEIRELPTYDLIVAKNGPKLPPPNDPPSPDKLTAANMGGGMVVTEHGIKARNLTLDGMLQAPWYGLDARPIVNKTGLNGTYNLTLNYTPNLPARPGADSPAPSDDTGPSIFTVLEEQLGLKLVPSKGPVEVIVIDHIEMPSEN